MLRPMGHAPMGGRARLRQARHAFSIGVALLIAGVTGPHLLRAPGYYTALPLQHQMQMGSSIWPGAAIPLRESCSSQTKCLPGVGHVRAGTEPRHKRPAHRVMGGTLCSTATQACETHLRPLPASDSDSSASAGGGGGASSATSVVPIAFRTCTVPPDQCYSITVKLNNGREHPLAIDAQ